MIVKKEVVTYATTSSFTDVFVYSTTGSIYLI